MVAFTDRRYERPDFEDGTGPFTLTTRGDEQEAAWTGREVDRKAKRDVHEYYRGQKDTATWKEANRLAASRSRRSAPDDADDYARHYEDNLARVMATKGPLLAKQFGEIKPGR